MLERLRERHQKAQCGDGGAVILRGEAGIGKSRVIERFLDIAGDPGAHVVATAALDYASSPFAPIVTIVETWLKTRPALFSQHVGLRAAVDLIHKVDAQETAPSAAERRRCFDAIAQLFRFASADAPTTVVVDDLHFADPATIQLLYHIVASTRKSPFFLLAAARPDDAAESGRPQSIARLERLDGVLSIVLGPLAEEACERIILSASGGRITREARQRIRERAEGNPLFVEELVRETLATGRPSIAGVPATIFETVLERFFLLSAHAQKALRTAAVLGRTFEASMVARIACRTMADLLEDIRHAVALGLIDETPDSELFRFRHALTQDAIYGTLLLAERQAMHRDVFSELVQRSESAEKIAVLAFHAHASGDRDAGSSYNELAGDQAAGNQAFESAVLFYEHALHALGESDAEAPRVCRKLANAHLLTGHPDRAVKPVQVALAHYRTRGSLGDITDALLQLADIALQAGEDERRLELLAEVCNVLAETANPDLQAKRSLCLFEIAIANHDAESVFEGSAALIASELVDATVKVGLQNARAHAFLNERRHEEAVQAQSEAVRLADGCGNDDLVAGARFEFGAILALSGKLTRASMSFGEAATFAQRRWAATEGAISIAFQAEMELIAGNPARARELLDVALDVARRSDHPALITMIGRVGIFLGVRTDDVPLIRNVVAAIDLEARFQDRTPEGLYQLSGAFAQFLAIDGRDDEARRVLGRAAQRLSAKRLKSTDWSPCTMITIAVAGDEDDLPKARVPIRNWFTPYAPAFVEFFDALVAARRGESEKTAYHADRAVPIFREFGFLFEAASALALAGRKEEAIPIFEDISAHWMAQRLRDDLTPKNRQGRPAHSLTARETDVATLVVDGLTNRQIADRLSVSEKTVETHLASIFTKLEIRSRTQLESRLTAGSKQLT